MQRAFNQSYHASDLSRPPTFSRCSALLFGALAMLWLNIDLVPSLFVHMTDKRVAMVLDSPADRLVGTLTVIDLVDCVADLLGRVPEQRIVATLSLHTVASWKQGMFRRLCCCAWALGETDILFPH